MEFYGFPIVTLGATLAVGIREGKDLVLKLVRSRLGHLLQAFSWVQRLKIEIQR